jgi:hypothetical protein
MRSIRCFVLALVASISLPASLHTHWRDDAVRAYIRARMSANLAAAHLPSFSRQTGLACSACHYQFLTLTFGRESS